MSVFFAMLYFVLSVIAAYLIDQKRYGFAVFIVLMAIHVLAMLITNALRVQP